MAVLPHARITLSGCFGPTTAPVEEWMFNLATGDRPTRTGAERQSFADAVGAAWTARLAPLYWPTTVLQRVRVAEVNGDGLVIRGAGGAFSQADHVQNRPGTATGGTEVRLPLSTALCVSLGSTRPGQAGKGRFFLPWPSTIGLSTDYRILAQSATDVATAARNFLLDVQAAAQNDLIIVGATSIVTGKPATVSSVTSVRVGRVPDTMRSRRSRMLEGYSTLVL